MKKKALIAYGTLLVILFLSHAFPFRAFAYAVPLFLTVVPILMRRRINFSFSVRDLIAGAGVSLLILAPLFLWLYTHRVFRVPSVHIIMAQIVLVSFPEEVFFRGFLQDTLGNNLMGVVVVSLMFSLSHIPSLLFGGNIYAPLTFFPSLVMGLLYMKTENVLPSTVFHFLANVLFLGFMI
ncbi:MAG: CPBP family intramembrane metalloprotease [Candidatus Sulfobium sp.]